MFSRAMLSIVKIGGSNKISIDSVVEECAELVKQGNKLVIVNGAHDLFDAELKKKNISQERLTSASGATFRHTSKEAVGIMIEVYGQQNENIAKKLIPYGIESISLYGVNNVLYGERISSIVATNQKGKKKKYTDHYGGNTLLGLNDEFLDKLLNNNIVPVICPPAYDKEEEVYFNIDGDRVTALLADRLNADNVFFCMDKSGLLKDVNDESTLIGEVNAYKLDDIKKQMKARGAYKFIGIEGAINAGVKKVFLVDGRGKHIINTISGAEGTTILGYKESSKIFPQIKKEGKITASIVSARGYAGNETLRLLQEHPNVELIEATSSTDFNKPIEGTNLKYSKYITKRVDVIFLATKHGLAMNSFEKYRNLVDKIIDLSGDHRLKNPEDYEKWYETIHPHPKNLEKFVYGIAELHREELKNANYIACSGCNAAATILPLYPLVKEDLLDLNKRVVVNIRVGSSEGGATVKESSHHPERQGAMRVYSPLGHRHEAEVLQELGLSEENVDMTIATDSSIIRGAQAVINAVLMEWVDEKMIDKAYQKYYGEEPFIRTGIDLNKHPGPKAINGTNLCDIGYFYNPNKIIVVSNIDNLMKGTSGQAIQAMNISYGFDEKIGLSRLPLNPQ